MLAKILGKTDTFSRSSGSEVREQRPMKFFTVPGDRLKEFAKEAKARGIL